MIPSAVLNAATGLEQTGTPQGFPVASVKHGHRRTVYIGQHHVLKLDNGVMDDELPQWRRSPADEAAEIQRLRGTRYQAMLPETMLVGQRVLVQERFDPNLKQFRRRQPFVEHAARELGIHNVHSDNVGWRGNTPVFLDLDYIGPDLTVILLLKTPKARELQGEASFWLGMGPVYLGRMVRNVRRFLPADTRVVVMTDRPDVVPEGCDTYPLTEDHPGWWSKMLMYRRDVSCGRCLYLDLDNLVCGPMPELLRLTPDPMIVPDDRQMPGMPAGGAQLFFAERVRYLWDVYAADPMKWQQLYHESRWPHASDQAFIAAQLLEREGRYMPFFQDLLGDGYVLNSRVELEAGAPWQKCRLVVGCYEPKPHQSTHPLYHTHWHDESASLASV